MVKLRKRSGPYNLRLAGCESEFGLCEWLRLCQTDCMLCGQIMRVMPRLAIVQVIWRSVIPFVYRNLRSDGGPFSFQVG